MRLLERTINKILLIDDDPNERYLLQSAIHSIAPTITVTDFFSQDVQAENFGLYDIIFLDINMPRVNGFEWLKLFRGAGISIPIVMYSTTKNEQTINLAYQAGANLFLTKPMDFYGLICSLKHLLSWDWSKPNEIKSSYFRNGTYYSFSAS
ncbi:MAG: response regulator [Flavisolibacter sp.]|nr:response regulator [Flavisolibacter sp.]